jgi:TonB family protein
MACHAQTPNKYGCEAPVHIGPMLTELEEKWSSKERYFETHNAKFQELITAYPGNFWILQAYVESAEAKSLYINFGEFVQVRRTAHEAAPDDIAAAFLYAVAVRRSEPEKALMLLEALTMRAPDFAPGWLLAARAVAYQSTERLRNFLKLCPDSIDEQAMRMAVNLPPLPLLVSYARALRQRIKGKSDPRFVSLLPILWLIEAKASILAGSDEFRRNVEDDLRTLRTNPQSKEMVGWGERHAEVLSRKVVWVGPGITIPSIKNQVPPSYSPEALAIRAEGRVVLGLMVDWEGKPQLVTVLEPIGYKLDERAIRAVRESRFEPARQNGTPVSFYAPFVVNFRLDPKSAR